MEENHDMKLATLLQIEKSVKKIEKATDTIATIFALGGIYVGWLVLSSYLKGLLS